MKLYLCVILFALLRTAPRVPLVLAGSVTILVETASTKQRFAMIITCAQWIAVMTSLDVLILQSIVMVFLLFPENSYMN